MATNIALLLNLITLIIVLVQTFYTKRALNVAHSSIELTKTSKQFEQLPRMEFIIHVTNILERWNEELKKVIEHFKKRNNEINKIPETVISPKGLIDKYMFEQMPRWLAVIYESGAQYYYNSSCLYKHIRGEKNKK